MPYDTTSQLWPNHALRHYFHDLKIEHRRQIGPTCVPTCLAQLTGMEPAFIQREINTQSPISWSDYLMTAGYQLAYCSTDFRRLCHYVDELIALDDLFLISTYSGTSAADIGREPDADGWIIGSHIALLHRDQVYDTMLNAPIPLQDYRRNTHFVKRIFRVVPLNFARSL